MNVRPLTKPDLGSLLNLYRDLHSSDAPLPDNRKVEETWNEILSNKWSLCLGGFVSSELICSCVLTVVPNLTRGCRPYAILENVVTKAEHRKKGYGRELLKEALSHAWAKECYKVMLLTGRKDDEIARFYKASGFDPEGKRAFVAKSLE